VGQIVPRLRFRRDAIVRNVADDADDGGGVLRRAREDALAERTLVGPVTTRDDLGITSFALWHLVP
jgi:hypothetical protein